MYKILVFFTLFFIIAAIFISQTNADDFNEDKFNLPIREKIVLKSLQSFSINLFQEINRTDKRENIFISPLSVSMVLGMLLNGADNATYESIQAVMTFNNLPNDEINRTYKQLINGLLSADTSVSFEIANSFWYSNSFQIKKAFFNTNSKYFNSEVSALDFADQVSVNIINNWVSKNTHKKIKTIIDSISPDEIIFLINAIYFKGSWKHEFKKDNTRDDLFFFIDGGNSLYKMMNICERFNYYEDNNLQIAELPYGNGHYSMLIFLPKKIDGLNDFIQSLDKNRWEDYISKLKPYSIIVKLPKFKVEYMLKLNDVLSNMGMANAFSIDSADFSRINPTAELAISRVIHKTFVRVDEEGTEAAAVTIAGYSSTSVKNKIRYFYANHPFLYVIREKDSGTILFMGRMDRPNWTE